MTQKALLLVPAVLAVFVASGVIGSAQNRSSAEPSEEAVERTRQTVQTLDEIYKSVIVLITDKYVQDELDYPAGSAAIDLFGEISKKEGHEVRLIDVTGDPYDPENVADDEFEKAGVQKLKTGEAYHEKVVQKDGQSYLRAMTAVPVVMDKCVMCHAHYADAEEGEAIGAVSYTLPIQ